MPCHTDPTPQERKESAIKTAASYYEPLLCSACRVLERLGYDFDENPALSVWWAKHQEEDAQKAIVQQQERLRLEKVKSILAKPLLEITPEERQFLRSINYQI